MPTNSSRDDICFTPTAQLAQEIKRGSISPVEVVDAYLKRIEDYDDVLNAYVTVLEDEARERAKKAERAVEEGDELGALHGVPIATKDLRDMKEGVRHTFGSKLFENVPAPRTSASIKRLEDAGAIILGKTNVPEFGHKGVTDNEVTGATATPLDTTKNAGGSSGGSASAVAGGLAPAATGSDSGGSIRIPAAACGVFGLKPSFGLIPIDSRPNVFGLKTHHSVQGPLTRTVEDAALLLDVLTGVHSRDPSSVPVDIDFRGAVDGSIDELSIAYSPELDVFPVDDGVNSVLGDAIGAFEEAGATVDEVTLDHGISMDELADTIETTFSTSLRGLRANLKEAFGVDLLEYPDMVSDSLLELLEVGGKKSLEDVAVTGITRTQLFDAVQDVLAEYDLLVTPTLSLSEGLDLHTDKGTEWSLALTWPFNWTGHPVAAVPPGQHGNLSVSMQIVGERYRDDMVLAASARFEELRPWHDIYPEKIS